MQIMIDNRPLRGIRVLELGVGMAAPLVTRHLAHFDAEVIKMESAHHPDTSRTVGPGWLGPERFGVRVWQDMAIGINESAAGKLGVGLDLKVPEGREAAQRILSRCDVFVSNYSAQAVASLGLDYQSVRTTKPDIVYLIMAGYGARPETPYYNYVAWGPNLSSLCGLDELTGPPGKPALGIASIAYCDYANAMLGLVAVLSALRYRRHTGKGQAIDLSQQDAAAALLGPALLDYEISGRLAARNGNRVAWAAPQGVYGCRGNDRWVAISVLAEDEWQAFCRVAGHPDWASDSRFATLADRLAHRDELDVLIGDWTAQHTPVEVAEWLQCSGVAASPVVNDAELIVDPHLSARDFWQLPDHARWGKDLITGNPIHLSDTPGHVLHAAPCVGEHNAYVLGELCGYSEAEIGEMAAKGAVFPMDKPEVKAQRRYVPWLRHFLPQLPWQDGDQQPAVAGRRPGAKVGEQHEADRAQGHGGPSMRDPKPAVINLQPLAGYRILDLADESGSYGTKVLADLGAEVIKIEPPGGSRTRRLPPFAKTRTGGDLSLYFAYMNTNKRSVTLDLDRLEGQAMFRRLTGWADAVFDTSAPGYMNERGIGYEQLRESHPRLVWVALTPFGLTGPRRCWKGSDLVVWASSSVLNRNGFLGEAPAVPGGSAMLAYALGALNGAAGCLLALESRRLTGRGQLVDVSLQETAIGTSAQNNVAAFLDDMIPRRRYGNRRSYVVPYGMFPCRDGHVQLVVTQPTHWPILADWIKEQTGNDAVTDPIFHDRGMRLQVHAEVEAWTESLTRQYTRQEFFKEAQRRGIPATPVSTIADLRNDPQLAARSFWTEMNDPEIGKVRSAGAPYVLSESPWQGGRAPRLGEHNELVYRDQLGISETELAALRDKGVI